MKHHRPYQLPPSAPAAARVVPGPHTAARLARERAMIDAGTHPLLAERLARRATENQARRDRHPRLAFRPEDPF